MLASRDEIGIGAFQPTGIHAGQARGERHAHDASLDRRPSGRVGPGTGLLAGWYRRTFPHLGRTIQTPDAINAAVAFRLGATVVTRNARDYPTAEVKVRVP